MKNATTPENLIGQRLKSEMKKRGINSTALASTAGVKTSFIYDVISGKSANPSTVKLARVADSLGVSLKFLVDSNESDKPELAHSDIISIPRLLIDTNRPEPTLISQHQDNEPHHFNKKWLESISLNPSALRLMTIIGDVMAPSLQQGNTVLIDTSLTLPSPPGIFIIHDGFALSPKRLELLSHLTPPRIRVMSDNPQYSTYEKSVDDIRIIGRVVWLARNI